MLINDTKYRSTHSCQYRRERKRKLGRIEFWRKLVNNNPLPSENSNLNLVLNNELLTLKE
jgi:hypothetical protein